MYWITKDSISKHKGMKNLEKRKCVHIIKCALHVRNNYAFQCVYAGRLLEEYRSLLQVLWEDHIRWRRLHSAYSR